MVSSMTGFGSAQVENEMGIFNIEIRSINNRYLDFSFRLSNVLSFLENDIRKTMKNFFKRGRIEVIIRWTRKGRALPDVEINAPLMEKIYKQVTELQERIGAPGAVSFGDLLSNPALYIENQALLDEKKLGKDLIKGIKKAIKAAIRSRKKEGERLAQELLIHIRQLETFHAKIGDAKQEMLDIYQARLEKKIEEYNQNATAPIDRQRLDSEILFFADKSDITEEIARLDSHIRSFRETLNQSENKPIGKHLDFICQEMNREVNTIGSKSHGTSITNLVISMKNVVEKLREQIQNIE